MHAQPMLLVVEDDPHVLESLTSFLSRNGFAVDVAKDGEMALSRIRDARPDLVVLDVGLPKVDGREVLRRLRDGGDWLPVILLTQYGGPSERGIVIGYDGADDYLNKPYDPIELLGRIRGVLRRARPDQPPLTVAQGLRSGELRLCRQPRRIFLGRQPLDLTPMAENLLEYLMMHPGEICMRDRLLNELWGYTYVVGDRIVDKYISELRTALKDDPTQPKYIETIPRQGYRFVGVVEAVPCDRAG
jgi:DNA-binding response OmpR family regulator